MTTEQITTLQKDFAETRTRLEQIARDLARLASPAPIAVPRVAPAPKTLAERLAAALRAKPRTMSELVLETGAKADRIRRALGDLAVYNLGTASIPVWTLLLGDEGPTDELIAKVEQIISLRPMTLQELADATGARRNRISGALVKIQVRGGTVENHGSQKIARWYAPPKRRA